MYEVNTMKKFALTLLSVLALSASISTPSSATSGVTIHPSEQGYGYGYHATFRVVGVAYNDVLNIRSGPGANRYIVTVLYPGQGGIKVKHCSNYVNWCRIKAGHKFGWVNMRYLSLEY